MSERDYKNTLNLPHTDFAMKANLAQREPEILKKWESSQLYQKIQEQNKAKPAFILPDGPPYANGNMHLGHALNKTLKDIILKSKVLSGYRAPFVPGWDCHGLPIELNVEKKVGKPGVKVDAKTFRQKCREYVLTQVDAQRMGFIRLGMLADWQNPYMTMDYGYEADIVRSLAKIHANGHLHKGYKPVHWCIDCGSALAEAEVEYADKSSPAVDVCFKVVENNTLGSEVFARLKQSVPGGAPLSLIIWTTTPWTLPANQAVAVHAQLIYTIIKLKKTDRYVMIALDLLESFANRLGLESNDYEIMGQCVGKDLEHVLLQHPFYDRQVPVVLGEHVTTETGTGLVHTAPAHGIDDYRVGMQYKLPVDNPVNAHGCYIPGTPLLEGQHVFKANETVIRLLQEKDALLHMDILQHSYPHCWRHKSPLIFRATPQWFIGFDQNRLRLQSLAAIKTVEWIPEWGEARIEAMVKDRPDWCISRQRTWCVPMCLFVHKDTGDLHPDTLKLMEQVAQKIEGEGIEAWYELDPEVLGIDTNLYQKSPDSLDVWFDSGVFHAAVLQRHAELGFPADLYLEGSDQHRGWFQSSLLTSVAMNGKAPYKQVLTHGFTVDASGRKESKSLGNVTDPYKIFQTLGADILRLWVSATDYRAEMSISDEILKRMSDSYRRIRNTVRFLLSNLNGFDPKQHLVPFHAMLYLDQWVLDRARIVQEEIKQAYTDYQFHTVYQKLHNFCSVDLGSFYLDIIKDRQYTGKSDGLPRRSAQTALYYLSECLVRWMAPILSFTAEEVWQHMPGLAQGQRVESVFLSEWFQDISALKLEKGTFTQAFWSKILLIRECVNKALEESRAKGIIGSGLEAEISLYCNPEYFDLLSALEDELRFVLITSQAKIYKESEHPKSALQTSMNGLWIEVKNSEHVKCERCWHRREDVGENPAYPGICVRCVENITETGEHRVYA
jgi:isoleucyl-tRNA synthetase